MGQNKTKSINVKDYGKFLLASSSIILPQVDE